MPDLCVAMLAGSERVPFTLLFEFCSLVFWVSVARVDPFLESGIAAVPLVNPLLDPSVVAVPRTGAVTEPLPPRTKLALPLFSPPLPPFTLASYLSPKVLSLIRELLPELATELRCP